MRVFIDTNLWVYRLDKREAAKGRRIADWLRAQAREHEIVVSTQVLIELRAVLTRKFKPPMLARDVRAALDALAHFDVVTADANLVLDAHELAGREQIEWFDALIMEAAIRSGCERLYSEDLSHGRTVGGLTILNPFLAVPDHDLQA